jgi:hypothetical protein
VNAAGTLLSQRLAAGLLAILMLMPAAWAVDAAKPAPPAVPSRQNPPNWSQLTADQKEALSPLQADWDKYEPARKKKWLDIAVRYKDLSPEGQQKMHERMPDLARLTPEQRKTARENFKRAYALPPEKRRELTQQFQELPEEKKRELAEMAKKKPAPAPRRPGASHAGPRPAEGSETARRDAPAGTPVTGAAPASAPPEPVGASH